MPIVLDRRTALCPWTWCWHEVSVEAPGCANQTIRTAACEICRQCTRAKSRGHRHRRAGRSHVHGRQTYSRPPRCWPTSPRSNRRIDPALARGHAVRCRQCSCPCTAESLCLRHSGMGSGSITTVASALAMHHRDLRRQDSGIRCSALGHHDRFCVAIDT
jgi:hypothetical protein